MKAHDKSLLRQRLLLARSALPEATRARYAAAIRKRLCALPQVAAAQCIFSYVSYGAEVPTHALLKNWLKRGKQLCVPLVAETVRVEPVRAETIRKGAGASGEEGRLPRRMLARPIHSLAQLRPNRIGIPEPVAGAECESPIEVSVTPGLGFSGSGARLGYGRGYYDHWFARHPEHPRVALAFEVQLCEELPMEPHDLPVHWIVTERRLIRTTAQFTDSPPAFEGVP